MVPQMLWRTVRNRWKVRSLWAKGTYCSSRTDRAVNDGISIQLGRGSIVKGLAYLALDTVCVLRRDPVFTTIDWVVAAPICGVTAHCRVRWCLVSREAHRQSFGLIGLCLASARQEGVKELAYQTPGAGCISCIDPIAARPCQVVPASNLLVSAAHCGDLCGQNFLTAHRQSVSLQLLFSSLIVWKKSSGDFGSPDSWDKMYPL